RFFFPFGGAGSCIKKKEKRLLFPPLSFFFPPAVGGALERKKALCEVHTRTGQRGVVFFTVYESE
ncbi:hypothetical protein, partial [Escherichia coli]|uniref:hypothetical protein n=1 Tax=Escherichia coli TaxID=562 RepID=UPI000B629BF5